MSLFCLRAPLMANSCSFQPHCTIGSARNTSEKSRPAPTYIMTPGKPLFQSSPKYSLLICRPAGELRVSGGKSCNVEHGNRYQAVYPHGREVKSALGRRLQPATPTPLHHEWKLRMPACVAKKGNEIHLR